MAEDERSKLATVVAGQAESGYPKIFATDNDGRLKAKLKFNPVLGTDHTASGIKFTDTAGENLVFGDVCYLKSDGKWWKADADAASTMPAQAIAIATIVADADGEFLLQGFARDDTWNWTIGGLIYASATAGGLTQTIPSGAADVIQVVGCAITADIIFFNPLVAGYYLLGGLQITNDGTLTTILGIAGDYNRIGDAAATSHSLASEDDLLVTGKLEVDGNAYFDSRIDMAYGIGYIGWNGWDYFLAMRGDDANAYCMKFILKAGDASYATLLAFGDASIEALDFGLFDGVTQPTIAMIEKDAQLHSATDGIADAGAASAILKHVGGFTAAVVGDIVRIIAGTLCTAGWYWITTVTSADQVTLDRNYTSGDTTNVTFVTYHDFTMLSADGVCTRVTDGAPDDNSVEIDRPGWLILDVGQANGRLYWRVGAAWHYVDATAGLSMPKEERIDPDGKEFNIGDEVRLLVDRINEDGSFHAMPYRRN